MEDDIFNEMASEDGSGELGHQVVIQSCNDCDSSNSPFLSASNSGLIGKHVNKIDNEFYHVKYEKIKKLIKGYVFENASLCDEVSHFQEKIVIAKEERRFLLRKLLSFQGQREGVIQQNPVAASATIQPAKTTVIESVDYQNKKKSSIKKRSSQKLIEESLNKAKSKKKKTCGDKRLVQPIPLDGCGRPIFPIILGALTIHSLGVIVPDRPGFHNEHFIFPAGFCSSRTYLSIKDPTHHCLYTCTIVDASYGPRFEIIPEDDPEHPIMGNTVNECHTNLLKAINNRCGKEIVKPEGYGARFFGLSHPTVQNLIQSCAGARKCIDYRWNHFEMPNQEKICS